MLGPGCASCPAFKPFLKMQLQKLFWLFSKPRTTPNVYKGPSSNRKLPSPTFGQDAETKLKPRTRTQSHAS